jgi:hypothetical protein
VIRRPGEGHVIKIINKNNVFQNTIIASVPFMSMNGIIRENVVGTAIRAPIVLDQLPTRIPPTHIHLGVDLLATGGASVGPDKTQIFDFLQTRQRWLALYPPAGPQKFP